MSRAARVLLIATAAAIGLCLVSAAVPALRPLVLHPVIEALGGVTCTQQQCPPDAGWVSPVEAGVSSGFRTEQRPDHHGVDLAAPRGAPVVAASAGLVILAECDARLDGEFYGCDRDGSAAVRGCGWHVKILHARHTATLYCHLQQRPEVSAGDSVGTGDLIGQVGSSGNSSEPHLHFEVQIGELFTPPRSATAVDPERFYAEREAALR